MKGLGEMSQYKLAKDILARYSQGYTGSLRSESVAPIDNATAEAAHALYLATLEIIGEDVNDDRAIEQNQLRRQLRTKVAAFYGEPV